MGVSQILPVMCFTAVLVTANSTSRAYDPNQVLTVQHLECVSSWMNATLAAATRMKNSLHRVAQNEMSEW